MRADTPRTRPSARVLGLAAPVVPGPRARVPRRPGARRSISRGTSGRSSKRSAIRATAPRSSSPTSGSTSSRTPSGAGPTGRRSSPAAPDESPLVRRVASADPEEVMPPKGDRLTDREIALIRSWVATGANWAEDVDKNKVEHWAFKAPSRPASPEVRDQSWPRNPVDRFVLARLEKEGMKPSPEADRTTLLRRLAARPDRPAADARGGRRLRRRPVPRRLSEGRRPAPGQSPLRRAMGPALARRGAVCGHGRVREGQDPTRLVLPRLGDQRPQS